MQSFSLTELEARRLYMLKSRNCPLISVECDAAAAVLLEDKKFTAGG